MMNMMKEIKHLQTLISKKLMEIKRNLVVMDTEANVLIVNLHLHLNMVKI